MKPKFFKDQWDFRKWLEKNHQTKTELIVGFYKVNSGKKSMTWSESVDQALCFGWIDGIRRSVDDESYQIRFTPRRSTSVWSDINISKVKVLTRLGLMQPAGMEAFRTRKDHKSGVYSYENDTQVLSHEYEKIFKRNKTAWKYFQSLAPSYRKLSVNWIMSAKQESTRVRRLNEVISHSEEQSNMWRDNKYKSK